MSALKGMTKEEQEAADAAATKAALESRYAHTAMRAEALREEKIAKAAAMSALKGMTKEEQEAAEAAETREALEARMMGVEMRAEALKAEKLAKAKSNSKAGAVREADALAASQKQAMLDQRFAAAQVST